MSTIHVEFDADEVIEGLKRVQARMGVTVRKALEIGSGMVANRAKAHHDYTDRTGVATNSVVAEPVTGSFSGGDLEATVMGGAAHYHFLERGTKRHKIRPKHRKRLRWEAEGGYAFAREVDHPGTSAYKPLENALDHEFAQITEVIGDAAEAAFVLEGF